MTDYRNQYLMSLSQLVVGGEITWKLDQIASIYINGKSYFNVFRRYNSEYNIVIEAAGGDVYLHRDIDIRMSLKRILYLNDKSSNNM